MKILMLVHRFPYPPTRGDCIRSWGEVEYLAARHDLWLACVDRVAPAPRHLAHVRRLCRDVIVVTRSELGCLLRGALSLLAGRSITEGYFWDKRLAGRVQEWSRAVAFDAVLTFSVAMAPYASSVPARRRVLDMNDVESARWRTYARGSLPPLRWLYALEARRLPRLEAQAIRRHDITLLVNECEQAKLPAELRAHAAVVHTGVDLTRYAQSDDSGSTIDDSACVARFPIVNRHSSLDPRAADQSTIEKGQPIVGFLGSMFYPPNVRAVEWFGRHVWPKVKKLVPQARWWIVGSRPVRRVRRWSALPDVTVTGFVDDVRPLLQAMRVFVCPVREQIGVQTKLIEALAAGRPAVVTPQAAAGIDYDRAAPGPPPFVVAASADEFAQAVARVLRDRPWAAALAGRARALAQSHYDADRQLALIEGYLSAAGENAECTRRKAEGKMRNVARRGGLLHSAFSATADG